MPVQVHVTACDRYRLRVTSWGSGRPPHALVIPGLSADWCALAPQIRSLRGLGWTVHVIDLPGFALTPALQAKDAHVVQLADYVAKVAEDLGVTHALVLGHSLGGGVALHLALRKPELVDGLILIAPAALGVSLHWVYKLYCVPLLGRALLRRGRRRPRSSARGASVGERSYRAVRRRASRPRSEGRLTERV